MSIATNVIRKLRLPVIGSPLFIISTPDLVIAQCKAGIVSSFPALSAREEVNASVHSYGGIVFHDVINQTFAHKAVDKGADGLILVAAGAGGHAGTTSPFAFVQETRQWFDGPIALSGANR